MFPGKTIIPRCIFFSSNIPRNLVEYKLESLDEVFETAYFRIVLTPTLLSSAKKTKIWSSLLTLVWVKKLMLDRLKTCITISTLGLEWDRKELLDCTPIARELITKPLKIHVDFLIRDLKALVEWWDLCIPWYPSDLADSIFDKFVDCTVDFP